MRLVNTACMQTRKAPQAMPGMLHSAAVPQTLTFHPPTPPLHISLLSCRPHHAHITCSTTLVACCPRPHFASVPAFFDAGPSSASPEPFACLRSTPPVWAGAGLLSPMAAPGAACAVPELRRLPNQALYCSNVPVCTASRTAAMKDW